MGAPLATVAAFNAGERGRLTGDPVRAMDCMRSWAGCGASARPACPHTHAPPPPPLAPAVLFSSWGALERVILGPEGGTMTAGQAALAGSLAGIPGCFLAAPTERIKCRLQAQAGRQPSLGQVFGAADYRAGRQLFRGPMDVLRSTVKYEGPLGVMRGLVPTMLREVPGNGAYFAGYELTKQWMARSQGLASPTDLGAGSLMLAGGVGGASFWAFVYPMDVIKTRLQTQNVFNPQYSGILDCTRKLLAEGGWRSLFRGFGPCMLRRRAFTAYELVKAQLAGRS
eukprot:scaffold3.g6193.t1